MPKFLKPVECNASIFYGVCICIDEISQAKKHKRFQGNEQQFIASYGLDMIKVGDDKYAQEYIIGKKLDYYHNFSAIKLIYDDKDNLSLKHLNGDVPKIKLSYQEELNIKQTIFKIGLLSFCDYYFIHTYKTNRV